MRRCKLITVSVDRSVLCHRSFLLPGKQAVGGKIPNREKIVNVLVTCTKTKTRPVPKALRFGSVTGRSVEMRAKNWIQRLATHEAEAISAEDLYAGDQWQIAKSLPSVGEARGLRVQLWVSSAGYGLIPATANLRPYSATYSSTHPDFVFRRIDNHGLAMLPVWWEQLMNWEGPCPGEPRSLADLARAFPQCPLLIVASTVYLNAMRRDVELALKRLATPELLTIVSGGTEELGIVSKQLLPCDARLQQLLGGARMSLNVRVAKRILGGREPWPFRHSKLVNSFRRLLAKQPAIKTYDRVPMTDSEVERFIRRQLTKNSMLRHSPMLRLLRDSGFACEQKRFRAMYERVQENRRD
jgi:hypothetical protein